MQTFYIVDDDLGIRKMLENIIIEYSLGNVIGEAEDGNQAIQDINELSPDIVLVDLLLPSVDGIEIVEKIKSQNDLVQFIMISEVKSKDMIAKAYKSGIEFFINKPLNVIEVVSVIEKVIDNVNLKKALSLIERTMERKRKIKDNKNVVKPQIIRVLSDLGILGETGSKDLINMLEIIIEKRKKLDVKVHQYKIGELYKELANKYEKEANDKVSIKAIEQRIRRVVQSSFVNISSIGLDDYTNIKFERYSNTLFDFSQVRKEMLYLDKKSDKPGKINIKKFIEGIIGYIEF
ncbi:response regulator [Clostridiaceae bacterium M8S5]|nr:response regulator [Clostridiaceae bacterium M8S5]